MSKYFLIFAAILAINNIESVFSVDLVKELVSTDDALRVYSICSSKIKLPDKVTQSLTAKKFSDAFLAPSEDVQCFAACFAREFGLWSQNEPNNKVIKEKLLAVLPEKEASNLMAKCQNITGKTACNKAFNTLMCYQKNAADLEKRPSA